jgi:hypothetical protein
MRTEREGEAEEKQGRKEGRKDGKKNTKGQAYTQKRQGKFKRQKVENGTK